MHAMQRSQAPPQQPLDRLGNPSDFAALVGRFRKLWPDRKTLTRAPKVGADGAASRYFWEWRSGQKRKLGRLSDSSLTNDRPLVDAFVAARPIFPTGPGRTFHSTR